MLRLSKQEWQGYPGTGVSKNLCVKNCKNWPCRIYRDVVHWLFIRAPCEFEFECDQTYWTANDQQEGHHLPKYPS